MEIPKPIMPKEHGLWAWIFLPFCVGAATSSGVGAGGAGTFGNLPIVFPAVFFGLMALTPARMIYKSSKKEIEQKRAAIFWCVLYAIPAGFSAVASIVMDARLAAFFLLYALGFYLGVRASHAGYQRNMVFEYGGIVFLSTGVFFGSFAVAGKFDVVQAAVWAFTIIFILDRSFQTRQIVRVREFFVSAEDSEENKEGLRLIMRINIFIALAAIAGVSAVLEFFSLGRMLLLAYAPGLFLTAYFYRVPPKSLRVVGYTELALVFVFGILFSTVFNGLYK